MTFNSPWLFSFLLLPFIDLLLLIKVGGVIGAIPTLLLIIAMGMAGWQLLRLQGLETMRRAQAALQRGESPTAELLQGLMLAVAGLLLLLPGFLSDSLALLCLLPFTRRWLLQRWLGRFTTPAGHYTRQAKQERVIEGEYWRER